MFAKCKEILPLWNALSARLYEKWSKQVGFNVCNISFGEYPLNGKNKGLNCTISYIKQYIFFCLKKERVPVLLGLYNYLHLRYKIEKSANLYKLENEIFEKMELIFHLSGSSMIYNQCIILLYLAILSVLATIPIVYLLNILYLSYI